jgi:leucyl aminopeptidase (aminopeptidase T)
VSEAEPDSYEAVMNFRASERAKMLAKMSELIEDAQKRAKSHNTLSRERPKWANLAGKLIWYRDQILRSMDYEAVWKEIQALKELVKRRAKERAEEAAKKGYIDMSAFQKGKA